MLVYRKYILVILINSSKSSHLHFMSQTLIQIIFTTHATEFILHLLRRFTNLHLFITIIFLFTSFLRKIMLLNIFLMFCRTSNCSKIRFFKNKYFFRQLNIKIKFRNHHYLILGAFPLYVLYVCLFG